MFDLMIRMPELTNQYISEVATQSVGDVYKHLTINQECQIRLAKYMDQPKKTWHADFIRSYGSVQLDKGAFSNIKKAQRVLEKINAQGD